MLAIQLLVVLCLGLGGANVASALQWCPGNNLLSGIVNDATQTLSLLGADSKTLNVVAVGSEFKALILAQFPDRGNKDLAIYSFDNAQTVVNPPVIIPFESFIINKWAGFLKPQLTYDGNALHLIYIEGNSSSPFKDGIVARRIAAGGVLQPPKLLVSNTGFDKTVYLNGFIAYSAPKVAVGPTTFVAFAIAGSQDLQVLFHDRASSQDSWLPLTFEPSPPWATGGVAMAMVDNRFMVCAVMSTAVRCYQSLLGAGGILSVTRVSGTVPLAPFAVSSHLFVASCGLDQNFMVGTETSQGPTSIVTTSDSGVTWGVVRDVSQVNPTQGSKLIGMIGSGGICQYSFTSKVYSGNVIAITTNSSLQFPASNVETIFPTSNNYDDLYLASNSSRSMFVSTRLIDSAYVSDNTWFAGCNVVTTAAPTSAPTPLPTSPPTTSGTAVPTVAPGTCFPGSSEVMTSRGLVEMKNLQVGDLVLDSRRDGSNIPTFSEVIAFLHKEVESLETFMEIRLDHNSTILTITEDHSLFVFDLNGKSTTVMAGKVQIGDRLMVVQSSAEKGFSARVVEIKRGIKKIGLYAPLTTTSSLVVDKILVSSFTRYHESVAHAAHAPLRWYAKFIGKVPECYSADGVHCYSRFLEILAFSLIPRWFYALPTSIPAVVT